MYVLNHKKLRLQKQEHDLLLHDLHLLAQLPRGGKVGSNNSQHLVRNSISLKSLKYLLEMFGITDISIEKLHQMGFFIEDFLTLTQENIIVSRFGIDHCDGVQ